MGADAKVENSDRKRDTEHEGTLIRKKDLVVPLLFICLRVLSRRRALERLFPEYRLSSGPFA
jgi:hypothetical protein